MKKLALALTVILGVAILTSCASKREACPAFSKSNLNSEKNA